MSTRQRRQHLVRRHHLAGDATSPEQVAASMVALHATDPGTVVLSVLARGHTITVPDILAALYRRRTLVRWMAMRRTLFVFPRATIPTVQASVSAPLAAVLRKRLVSRLLRNGSEPPIDGDPAAWLTGVEAGVERALRARGAATGRQLGTDEPRLRTAIAPRAASDVPMNVTSPLLTIMGTEARLVRGDPVGAWTTRQHRWEPVATWWPDGLPDLDVAAAQDELATAWSTAFGGPASDLQWWTGWTGATTRAVLARLPVAAPEPPVEVAPVAALLPALDPTPMGWKDRDWFFGIDRDRVFDRNGNIGPTLWWDGEIIGGWAIAPTGEVRIAVLADRGREAVAAAESAAA